MDIVKQRKKRLLAWILTLVLCVYMWQGSAQATGTEGGDGSDLTETETSAEETPELATETPTTKSNTTYTLTVTVVDSSFNDVSEQVLDINMGEMSGVRSETDSTFLFEGVSSFGKPELMIGDISYNHKFIDWYAEDKKIIDKNTSVSKNQNVYAMFGSSLYVEWSGLASGEGIAQENAQSTNFVFSTPDVSMTQESEEGDVLFFSGWTAEGLDGGPYACNEEISIPISSFEKVMPFNGAYGTDICLSGEYSLTKGETYRLGTGQWTVDEDGYTYTGENSFVAPEEKNYLLKVSKNVE